jgi:hypothetical protein
MHFSLRTRMRIETLKHLRVTKLKNVLSYWPRYAKDFPLILISTSFRHARIRSMTKRYLTTHLKKFVSIFEP